MDLLIGVVVFLFLLGLGFFVGGAIERRHLKALDHREHANRAFYVTQLKSYPMGVVGQAPPAMVFGEVVISSDYLKTFTAKLRNIFGGEVRSLQTLLLRARREALQRAIDDAQSQGYNALCNLRYDFSDIGGGSRNKAVMVTLIASGTAYYCRPPNESAASAP
jgi:uncharacterized protein YbjQ (UPF0145 family)